MADDSMVTVRKTGATVNGHAGVIIASQVDGLRREIADYTRFEVIAQLDSVLQHQTGFYVSQIRTERMSTESYRVHDGGVVYGPWLEGTGSRNAPVTRFAGYHSFRVVGNRMAQKSKAISDAWAARAVRSL